MAEPTLDRVTLKRQDFVRSRVISDKEESKKQSHVQSRVNFGQGRVKKAKPCPKSCQLRTRKSQKGKVVSEVVSTSDKEESKRQGGVRGRVNFRQGRVKKARWCPKTNKLRTRKSIKSKVVSEVMSTSDKERLKKQSHVQSRVNFGQGRAKKARWCPKSYQLRTRKSQKSKAMSEVESTSDKEESKKQSHVRSRVNFGHGKAKKTRQCPKSSKL